MRKERQIQWPQGGRSLEKGEEVDEQGKGYEMKTVWFPDLAQWLVVSGASRKNWRNESPEPVQMKTQDLGTNGRVSCGLIQPKLGPSTRTRAAYGIYLGFVALDKGSDISSFSLSLFLPWRGHRPSWCIGIRTWWSLLCWGNCSFFLQCSIGFHLV